MRLFKPKKEKEYDTKRGRKFEVSIFCMNCAKYSKFQFPFGTEIKRTRYANGERGTKAKRQIDSAPGWEDEIVTCPKCGSKNLG